MDCSATLCNLSGASRLSGAIEPGHLMRDTLPGDVLLEGTSSAAPASSSSPAAEVEPSSVPNAADLSPEALMAYCSARLSNLDSQMNSIMTQQQQNGQSTSDVNAIAAALDDLPGPASGSSGSNPSVPVQNPATIQAAYEEAIKDCGPSQGQLKGLLENDLTSFNNQLTNNNGSYSIPSNLVSSLGQSAKNYASTLNSDSEMQMITLQSLMSQRETAVQLTTNLVQSLGEQSSDITKNIGQ